MPSRFIKSFLKKDAFNLIQIKMTLHLEIKPINLKQTIIDEEYYILNS